eukprot:CAMPEP_0114247812 /NCGR_PEP_ID=MMETSP0058-20121206/13225_1 /TAXON_ID=36894 /ORGANISM="Pyramimonas parkeae, CCMP726" /LENGTH=397 /DNA_ID=CAMNT_0001361149 /DNA_START=65 /DNA_END=1261 /DNA_ORIENTATION=+
MAALSLALPAIRVTKINASSRSARGARHNAIISNKSTLRPQLRAMCVERFALSTPNRSLRASRMDRVVVPHASDAAAAPSADDSGKEKSASQTLTLGLFFAGWYAFNIYFNIYNKQVLSAFPFPWTCTAFQFAIGICLASVMWLLRLHPFPKTVTSKQLGMILPLAAVHTLGNLLTNVSLGKVAVSFTHTIKAMEPFFSVLLSSIFLGDAPTLPIILSLSPIVGGVALASISEVSFNWTGFLAAMGSNLTFQSRNVLSKKLMSGDAKKGLDNINLFSIITIMSFFLLAPFTLFVEGFKLTPAVMAGMNLDFALIMRRLCIAAFCFHAYQQVSYMILAQVTPVTHSVGNCVKRVVVIVSSVIFFRSPVSPLNAVGTAIALAGVFAYSQVKKMSGKKKA